MLSPTAFCRLSGPHQTTNVLKGVPVGVVPADDVDGRDACRVERHMVIADSVFGLVGKLGPVAECFGRVPDFVVDLRVLFLGALFAVEWHALRADHIQQDSVIGLICAGILGKVDRA